VRYFRDALFGVDLLATGIMSSLKDKVVVITGKFKKLILFSSCFFKMFFYLDKPLIVVL